MKRYQGRYEIYKLMKMEQVFEKPSKYWYEEKKKWRDRSTVEGTEKVGEHRPV